MAAGNPISLNNVAFEKNMSAETCRDVQTGIVEGYYTFYWGIEESLEWSKREVSFSGMM